MMEHMGRTGNQLKVLDGVIKFITVDMVNDFMRQQFSSKTRLDNRPVFKDDFSVSLHSTITLSGDSSFSVSSLLPEVRVPISVPSEIVPIAHLSFRNPALAVETVLHKIQYMIDTENCQDGILNNRVNCWNPLTDNAEGNQQPSPVNGKEVTGKVQRLMGEEPTNNPNTSARRESDDIVWTYGKP